MVLFIRCIHTIYTRSIQDNIIVAWYIDMYLSLYGTCVVAWYIDMYLSLYGTYVVAWPLISSK